MYVLVLASQKGGSGKTTLSGHLAVEAQSAGIGPVALIDTDPQGSLSHWWNARSASEPMFAKVGTLELSEALDDLREAGIALAVIDTPPAITQSIAHVISHADLVVLPTRPSPHDLRAVGATVDAAEQYGKALIFVINAATARARITGETAVALSQHGTVAPVTVHHRVNFASSMVDGRTVGEILPKSASAKEIRELWIYVQDRLARLKQDQAFKPPVEPAHFAVSGLSSSTAPGGTVAEDPRLDALAEPELAVSDTYAAAELVAAPPEIVTDTYTGPDRRSGFDRRRQQGDPPPGMAERRLRPFGRRITDPQPWNQDDRD